MLDTFVLGSPGDPFDVTSHGVVDNNVDLHNLQPSNANSMIDPARQASVPSQFPAPLSFELKPVARAPPTITNAPSRQSDVLSRPAMFDQSGYPATYPELSRIIQTLHQDLRAERADHFADMMKVRAALGQQFGEWQTQIGEQQKTLDTANDATKEAIHIIEFIQSQLANARARVAELDEDIDAKDNDIRQLRRRLHTHDQFRQALSTYQDQIRRLTKEKSELMQEKTQAQSQAHTWHMNFRQANAVLHQSSFVKKNPEEYIDMLRASVARHAGEKLNLRVNLPEAAPHKTPTYFFEIMIPNSEYTPENSESYFKLSGKRNLSTARAMTSDLLRDSALKNLKVQIPNVTTAYKGSDLDFPDHSIFHAMLSDNEVVQWVERVGGMPETTKSRKPILRAYVYPGEEEGGPAKTAFFCEAK